MLLIMPDYTHPNTTLQFGLSGSMAAVLVFFYAAWLQSDGCVLVVEENDTDDASKPWSYQKNEGYDNTVQMQ